MKCFEFNPAEAEDFKNQLQIDGWSIIHQDAGQTHLVGWGYEITWAKAAEKVTLRYSDKQGQATAILEMTDAVFVDMKNRVKPI